MTPRDEKKVADLFGIEFDPVRPPVRHVQPKPQPSSSSGVLIALIAAWFLGFVMGFLVAPH